MAYDGSQNTLSNTPEPSLSNNPTGSTGRNETGNRQYHYSQFSVASSPTTSSAIQPGECNGDTDRKKISCNSCRQRKIKCDRGNPCSQCTSSFNDCLYAEHSRKRKRKSQSSDRIDSLESRMKAVEAYIPLAPVASTSVSTPTITAPAVPYSEVRPRDKNDDTPTKLYHTIEQGEMEFQGYSADRTFIQELKEKLGDWPGGDTTRSQLPPNMSVPGLFDLDYRLSDEVTLPTKEWAKRLVEAALDAQILLHIIHRPSFDASFSLIYSLERSEYSVREVKFLPLLYAVLAYGCLFIESGSDSPGGNEMLSQGSKYYAKSRQLQDIANCRDLVSLQAIVFMNLFLLSTSRSSTCYTYLSASLSIALRMGLHRAIKTDQDLISQEISKRLFWVLRLLVNDLAACCGMPRLLSDEEVDQELPKEVNDIYIGRRRISMQPQCEICYISGANAYNQLHLIRDKVTRQIYPVRGLDAHISDSMAYAVNLETVREIEGQLNRWAKSIPWGYRLGTYYGESRLTQAQYILCISYAHIHLYLYRPLLHYAIKAPQQQSSSQDFSSYVTACIQASQNIVALCEDMCKRGLLNGGNWPAIRMLFSSILKLFYVILVSRSLYEAEPLFKSLATGRKVMSHLAKQSHPGNRCKVMLKIMTSTLPKDLQDIRDRLSNFDSEVPDVIPNERSQIDDTYTASLAERAFSLRPNSRSSSSAHGPKDQWQTPSPSTLPNSITKQATTQATQLANGDIEARPLNLRQDGFGELWNASDGVNAHHSEINDEPVTGMFDTGGIDLEDFFDFQSWF